MSDNPHAHAELSDEREPTGDTHTQTLPLLNTLPPELLGHIFTFLVAPGDLRPIPSRAEGNAAHDPQFYGPTQIPSLSLDIIRLTHVCRHWRAVAIGTPHLWTSFALFHQDLVQECLARSKTLPLSIALTNTVSTCVSLFLGDTAHRLRSVFVFQTTKCIETMWRQLVFTSPAPCLEELFIENVERSVNDIHILPSDPAFPLPTMFGGDIPHVRILVLRGVPMPFASLPSSLVYFELVGPSSARLPPFPSLLATLRTCTSLETLIISGSFERGNGDALYVVSDAVVLPKLSRLHMEIEPARAPGVFLASLALPAHTNVMVITAVFDGGAFRTVLGAITRSSAPPCFQGFRCLRASWNGNQDWHLQAYREPYDDHSPAALDVDGTYYTWVDVFHHRTSRWSGFLYELPFDSSRIETLVLDHSIVDEEAQAEQFTGALFGNWRLLFEELPSLKTLTMRNLLPNELMMLIAGLVYPKEGELVCRDLLTIEIISSQLPDEARIGLHARAIREIAQRGYSSVHKWFNTSTNERIYLQKLLCELF